jgi:hypothetical protein
MTSVPTALSALRRGPSGTGFIQGSRDFLNRVWIKEEKHDLSDKHYEKTVVWVAKDELAINRVSYYNFACGVLALYADLGLAIEFKPPCSISSYSTTFKE